MKFIRRFKKANSLKIMQSINKINRVNMKNIWNTKNTKNIKNVKIIKKYLLLIAILILFLILSAYSYVSAVSNNLSDSVFRLHVIANSDSKEDQELKYMVRDGLIEYMNSLVNENNLKSKEDVINLAKENINNFKNIAKQIIEENGFNYDVNIEIGNFSFPTKSYGDISFPAGFYDALKVEIGNSEGQNWWCVMFPPLCFVDVTSGIVPDDSKENLEENLGEEEYNLINNDEENAVIDFKFKIVEFFENLGIKLAGE